MKKFSGLFLTLALGGLVFSSCSKKTAEEQGVLESAPNSETDMPVTGVPTESAVVTPAVTPTPVSSNSSPSDSVAGIQTDRIESKASSARQIPTDTETQVANDSHVIKTRSAPLPKLKLKAAETPEEPVHDPKLHGH